MTTDPSRPEGDPDPLKAFKEFLTKFAAEKGLEDIDPKKDLEGIDLADFAKALGLPMEAAGLENVLSQLQFVNWDSDTSPNQPVNWDLAKQNALTIAGGDDPETTDEDQHRVDEALRLAEAWLEPLTTFPTTGQLPQAWSRSMWVTETFDAWRRLTEPVAVGIANVLSETLSKQLPEEMTSLTQGPLAMIRSMGGTIFGTQLGQALGALAKEVLSATDIGVPLAENHMALLPTNIRAFGEGLEVSEEDVRLFLALRNCAHSRLFIHVPWLRGHLLGLIEAFARGIHIDTERIEEITRDIDPSEPEQLRDILSQGVFVPQRTEQQTDALNKLETMLALVEGWVDTLSFAAAEPLPSAAALREAVRRRRATGGPAEHAFSSLVGLELRPRRLREAAVLWSTLTDQRGIEGRDAIWSHPDLLPHAEDLHEPERFAEQRAAQEASGAKVDEALQQLLTGKYPPATIADPDEPPHDDSDGTL